jgi:hypothetical protein
MNLGMGLGRQSQGAATPTLNDTLTALSLTTNLKLCIDWGFGGRYPGTVFPAPVTTGSNEGWYPQAAPATQPAWANLIHKNSAQYSLMCFAHVTGGTAQGLLGDSGDATTGTGFRWAVRATNQPQLGIFNAGATVNSTSADTSINSGAWNMIAVSVDETSASGGVHYLNGAINQVSASNTFDPTYSSPDTAAAKYVIEVAAQGNHETPLLTPMGCIAVWQGTVLTTTHFGNIWSAMRARFGL